MRTNYKELLQKYIRHVKDCEGSDFIDQCNGGCGRDVKFSQEEIAALERAGEALE